MNYDNDVEVHMLERRDSQNKIFYSATCYFSTIDNSVYNCCYYEFAIDKTCDFADIVNFLIHDIIETELVPTMNVKLVSKPVYEIKFKKYQDNTYTSYVVFDGHIRH